MEKKIYWIFGSILAVLIIFAALNLYQVNRIDQGLTLIKSATEEISRRILPSGVGKISPSTAPIITPDASTTPGNSGSFEIVGIVKYSNVEGGCWYIEPEKAPCEGGRCPLLEMPNYEPVSLAKELKKVGLKAKFTLKMEEGRASICQIGPQVSIINYQILP